MRRHEDHVGRGIHFHDPFQHFHAADAWHHQVGEDDLWPPVEKDIQAVFGIRSSKNLKTGLPSALERSSRLPTLSSMMSTVASE
jgi:hypothetical protein